MSTQTDTEITWGFEWLASEREDTAPETEGTPTGYEIGRSDRGGEREGTEPGHREGQVAASQAPRERGWVGRKGDLGKGDCVCLCYTVRALRPRSRTGPILP